MNDFKEQYDKYIAENKSRISNILKEKRHKYKSDFDYDFQRNGFKSALYIVWFLFGVIAFPWLENKIILYIIIFVAWIGIGLLLWIFVNKYTEDIADYFFSKYQHNKIIEEYIKRDEQRDIKILLDEMFSKDRLNIDDLDVFLEVYEFKLQDIKYFYSQCLSEIRNEKFEEN